MNRIVGLGVGLLVVLGGLCPFTLAETQLLTLDNALAQASSPQTQACPEVCPPCPTEPSCPCGYIPLKAVNGGVPCRLGSDTKDFTLSVNYYLMSDYVYRGLNLTEYRGEGREDLVHQVDVNAEYKFTDVLGIGGRFLGTWYAGAEELYGSSKNTVELRYTPYVFADLDDIASRVYLGFNFYEYPVATQRFKHDQEWWLQVCHNDAWMWKCLWPDNEKGVLNPFFYLAQNIDSTGGAMFFMTGVRHEFEIPCVPCLTITPQITLGADHRLLSDQIANDPSTKLLYTEYGLTIGYDLGQALNLASDAGTLTLSGSLYFSQAWEDDLLEDEFYGGMQIGWNF